MLMPTSPSYRIIANLIRDNTLAIIGIIGVKNCRQAVQSLGLNVEKETVQSLANDDDAIDFDTFRNLAGPKVVHRDKALHAFSLFDKDGKGVICYEDLQRVALELGESLSERELLEMLDDADTEGDGLLSKEDFLSVTENMNLNV